jgi:TPR repeat protein
LDLPIDLKRGSHYFRFLGRQGDAVGPNNQEVCLPNGIGVPMELKGAVHYFKLSDDQGSAHAQNQYGLHLHDARIG